jgi:Fe-S oxidoreductase
MMEGLLSARAGHLPWAEAADLLGRCSGCEACRVPCEYEQDVPEMLYAARAEAWEASGPPASLADLHETHLRSGNPFGIDLRTTLQEHALADDFKRKGRVLYWPGCRGIAEAGSRIAAEMDLLRSLGADHLSLPSRDDVPGCCGGALRAMGDRPGFQASAAGLQQYFNRQRTWVSPSATCLHTLRTGYPSVGIHINAEVLHLGQYLLFFRERLEELGRSARAEREEAKSTLPPVFLHSSCTLHRRLGRSSPTAEVLAAVLGEPATPLPPGPDRTDCCGAGDFHDLRRPEAASEVARWSARRIELPAGAWIVTGDSTCRGALSQGFSGRAEVFDLMGFLLAWLEPAL